MYTDELPEGSSCGFLEKGEYKTHLFFVCLKQRKILLSVKVFCKRQKISIILNTDKSSIVDIFVMENNKNLENT